MENNSSKRHTNKERKKELFINAAEKLFLEKGFESTLIDDVAKDAGLTKRTLYQYFTSKEDLFFAVTVRWARKLFNTYEEAMNQGENVLEKIQLGNKAYLQFYTDNFEMFRLFNYQPVNQISSEASPHFQEIRRLDFKRLQVFMGFVDAAKKDGSINPGLDLKKAVFFGFFVPFSLLYTVSSVRLWDLLELDEQDFLNFSFDLLTDAMKQH